MLSADPSSTSTSYHLRDTIKNPTVTYSQWVGQPVVELGSAYYEVTHTNTILLEQSQGHSLSYLCLVLCCQLFNHRLVAGLWKEVCYWLSIHCISMTCVAWMETIQEGHKSSVGTPTKVDIDIIDVIKYHPFTWTWHCNTLKTGTWDGLGTRSDLPTYTINSTY